MDFRYQRVPQWIAVVAAVGVPIAGIAAGPWGALGFALGAAGSWWNYASLVKIVNALAQAAVDQKAPRMGGLLANLFLRMAVLAFGSIAILKYSKISLPASMVGLFASCLGIGLEISYELLWKSTKSG